MNYHVSLTENYKKELNFLQDLIAKELDANRTCVIETSDEMNPYNAPKYIDLIFKIDNLEFVRVSYESYGKVDNNIHYKSKEVETDTYIDNIMQKLPSYFNN